MTRNLYKIQKEIAKKRGGKVEALHEKSRDAKRLRRAGAREERLARVAAAISKGRQLYLDRVTFFQECIQDASSPISDADLADLINKYIHRSDAEIEELQQERRKGRPPSKREEALKQRMQVEEKELTTGFWMPDLTQEEVRSRLASWNGDWSSLSTIQFIRFTRDGGKQPSIFPPKGLS
ncbi:translation machinery-associated protein 16 [Thermoascus aurantiacus ATCC 26904]